MSINFEDEMNSEVSELIKKILQPVAIDKKTALLENMQKAMDRQLIKKLTNTAKQPMTFELNQIGDRKEVGGMVYELDAIGWKRLPIGTKL